MRTPNLTFSTSGNEPRRPNGPVETQSYEGSVDVNEADNNFWMLGPDAFLQMHVMKGAAKVKCFERGQMTQRVKRLRVKS